MYANVDEKFLSNTMKDAAKQAIEDVGEEGKGMLIWPQLKDTFDEIDFKENEMTVMLSNELGSFSIDIPIDADMLEKIVSVSIKKLNKIKSLLESLK